MTEGFFEKNVVGPVCRSYGYEKKLEPVPGEDPCFDWKKKVSSIANEKAAIQKEYDAHIASSALEIDSLKSLLASNKQMTAEEKFWRTKYPTAKVDYECRPLPGFDKLLRIDPRILITPADWKIVDQIKREGFQVDAKNHDEIRKEIYNWARKKKYGYAFDWTLYGPKFPEVWEFPCEIEERIRIKQQKAADCDSWAIYLKTCFLAAGIPDYKDRIVIGNCELGGHATLYSLSGETNKFHHLNSTYGHAFENKTLSSLPTTDDAKERTDAYGIWGVWLSFDAMCAYNKFVTEKDQSDFQSFLGEKMEIIKVE